MPYANNKGTEQPAHPHSPISAFVVHCLDSIIPLVSISEISSLYLASVTVQAGLSLTWSKTPKKGFLMTRLIYPTWTLLIDSYNFTEADIITEPHHEKTCLRGLRPGNTQTGLLRYRD